MKRYLKSIIAILLTAVLLLSAACGGNESAKKTDPTQQPTEAPTEEPVTPMEDILAALGTLDISNVKNVILYIGDGMGQNHVPAADAITGGRYNGKLTFEYLPSFGTVDTKCLEGEPDSASGGTALACGYRGNRKLVGMDSKKNVVQSVTELAHSLGKSTGVLTSESIVDATPATFSIHTDNRNDEQLVASLQITDSVADYIIGGGSAVYDKLFEDSPEYKDKLTEKNVTWVKTWDDVKNFTGEGRLIATLTEDFWEDSRVMTPTLPEMTEFLIDKLSRNENGFFLMVEGGALDEIAHAGDVMEMSRQMIEFDKSVELGVRYAYEHKDTIIIVTADHNTGALLPKEEADAYIERNKSNQYIYDDAWCLTNAKLHSLLVAEDIAKEKNPGVDYDALPYRFTTIAHTSDPVNIWALGPGTKELAETNKLKTFQIGKFIGTALSGEEFGSTDKNGK